MLTVSVMFFLWMCSGITQKNNRELHINNNKMYIPDVYIAASASSYSNDQNKL